MLSARIPHRGGMKRFEIGRRTIKNEMSVGVRPLAWKKSGINGSSAPWDPKKRK